MKTYCSIIITTKEISDRLIHSAPRSVSLVHYTFRNDGQPSFHKAERTGAGNEPCEFAYAESHKKL